MAIIDSIGYEISHRTQDGKVLSMLDLAICTVDSRFFVNDNDEYEMELFIDTVKLNIFPSTARETAEKLIAYADKAEQQAKLFQASVDDEQ